MELEDLTITMKILLRSYYFFLLDADLSPQYLTRLLIDSIEYFSLITCRTILSFYILLGKNPHSFLNYSPFT